MEIGKKPLSEPEFNYLWSVLFQEFHSLSTSSTCNATLVYNTVYKICTSSTPYEDRLYWKIGDFFFTTCKAHRTAIKSSTDYLLAYAQCFCRYASLVTSINRLACFLNECIRGRSIDDFGYLLWERCIVQDLPDTFFLDVYFYKESAHLNAVSYRQHKELQLGLDAHKRHMNYSTDNTPFINKNTAISNHSEINDNDISDNSDRREDRRDRRDINDISDISEDYCALMETRPFASEATGIPINKLSTNHNHNINYEEENNKCNKLIAIPLFIANKYNIKQNTSNTNSIRIVILHSLFLIRPDPSDKYLYYKERYEKSVLNKIKEKYRGVRKIQSLGRYSRNIAEIVGEERREFINRFLEISREEFENMLEEIMVNKEELMEKIHRYLMGDSVVVDASLISRDYVKNIMHLISKRSSYSNNSNINSINNSNGVNSINNGINNSNNGNINNGNSNIYYDSIDNINSPVNIIFRNLSCLNTGFICSKNAYALFIIDMLNIRENTLKGEIEEIYRLYRELNIVKNEHADKYTEQGTDYIHYSDSKAQHINYSNHGNYTDQSNNLSVNSGRNDNTDRNTDRNDIINGFSDVFSDRNDFTDILVELMKFALQKIKPCFISRLVKYTNGIANSIDTVAYSGYVDNRDNLKCFGSLINLVPDRSEFLKIYKIELKERLLMRKSSLEGEYLILSMIGVDPLDKMYKMVDEIKNNNMNIISTGLDTDRSTFCFRIINSSWWDMSDKENIIIPSRLINDINKRIKIVRKDENYKIQEKIVKFNEEYSKIFVGVGEGRFILNIKQYSILESIASNRNAIASENTSIMNENTVGTDITIGEDRDMIERVKENTNIDERSIRSVIGLFIKEGLLTNSNGYYHINTCFNNSSILDLSMCSDSANNGNDVCTNSYLQALGARILKKVGKIERSMLEEEIRANSRIEIETDKIKKVIDVLVDKGIGDEKEKGYLVFSAW